MRIYRFFAVEMSYTVIVDGPGWIASDREPRAGGIAISMSALGFYEIVTECCLLQFSCVNSNYFAPSEELS